MVSTWALVVMLVAGAEPSVEVAQREETRLHGEVSLAAGAAWASPVLGLGPGLHLQLGAVMSDRVIVSARATVATVVVAGFFQLGASVAWALNDRFQLGGGLAWTGNAGVNDGPGVGSIHVPLRLAFLTRQRTDSQIARTGFQLGLEVAPGVAYAFSGGLPEYRTGVAPAFSISGVLTLGYAAW